MQKSYREYKKHEFCCEVNCPYLQKEECTCKGHCYHTAKSFHKWLEAAGFKISKYENNNDDGFCK